MCIRDRYTAFPASFSNVIGVKAKDTFNIDAEGLRDKGVDFAAPSEHKIWFGGNDITPVSYTHLDVYKRQHYNIDIDDGIPVKQKGISQSILYILKM